MPSAMSAQEEETLALAAIGRLGEASAHEVAQEIGVEVIRHTLGRLTDAGRLRRRQVMRLYGLVWVYSLDRVTA